MKKLIILIFILLLPSQVFSTTNFFSVRGEMWNDLFRESSKLIYVMGLMDGLILSEKETQDEYLGSGLSSTQYVSALDQFYKDYKNSLIPVPLALTIITSEVRGKNKKDIEKELIELRAIFAESSSPLKEKHQKY